MKLFSEFITSYKRSIRDFSFYREVIKKPFFFSLQFLYLLTFLVLFINTLLFVLSAAFYLPALPERLTSLQSKLAVMYPKDLIITIQEGTITSNQKEPVYLDIADLDTYTPFNHFITIHTQADVLDYTDSDSMILVTRNSVIYPDMNNSTSPYRVESASDFGNTVINYQVYTQALSRLNSFLDMLPSIAPWLLLLALIIVPLFGAFIVTAWRLLILFILTAIMLPLARIFGTDFTYGQLYRMGMHALVAPITLSLVLNMFGTLAPLAFTACFMLWMAIILARLSEREVKVE